VSAGPQNQTAVEESSAAFTATILGVQPMFFQWLFNGQALAGATNQTLTLTNLGFSQAGNYALFAMNRGGSVVSDAASLTVLPLPVITSQPVSTNVLVGAPATFRVTATGSGALSYQWQFNWANLPGATNSTLTLTNLQLGQSGEYRVLITDTIGTRTSREASLGVLLKPTMVQSPAHQTLAASEDLILSAEVTGTGPFYYRWRRNNGNMFTNTFMDGSSHTLVISNAALTNAGTYDVIVTNLATALYGGQAISARALVVVVEPPASQSVPEGSNVTLRARLSGPNSFTNRFAWVLNGTNILKLGTNTSASAPIIFTNDLVLNNFSAEQAGTYAFFYSNAIPTTNPPPYTNFYTPPTAFEFTLSVGAGDRDGDGLPDDWELASGLNPDDPADAGLDADGDGLSNRDEYAAGTNPQDALSYLKIEAVAAGGGVELKFMALSNRTYSVMHWAPLASINWLKLADVEAASTNREVRITDTPAATVERYYRLRTPKLP
jgi:hypothetical protein